MAIEVQDFLIQQRAKSIKVFEHKGRDLHDDTMKSARNLGQARINHSRLNLFTSLTVGDKEDNFKFQVPTEGNLRFGIWPENAVRIEMMNSRGKVIADSEGTGRLVERFEDIIRSKDRIKPGEYFIRITRSKESPDDKEIPYSLQIQVGNENRKDFDTTEYEADPKKKGEVYEPASLAKPTAGIRQGEMLVTMLGNGLNNLNMVMDKTQGIFKTIYNQLFR
jgi:hypothetical protein